MGVTGGWFTFVRVPARPGPRTSTEPLGFGRDAISDVAFTSGVWPARGRGGGTAEDIWTCLMEDLHIVATTVVAHFVGSMPAMCWFVVTDTSDVRGCPWGTVAAVGTGPGVGRECAMVANTAAAPWKDSAGGRGPSDIY